MNDKSFDCVNFQREIRDNAIKLAGYDIRTLINQVNERLKNDELNNYLELILKEKQLKSA